MHNVNTALAAAFVQALLSTFSAHSSAATTFFISYFPGPFLSTLLAQKSAVLFQNGPPFFAQPIFILRYTIIIPCGNTNACSNMMFERDRSMPIPVFLQHHCSGTFPWKHSPFITMIKGVSFELPLNADNRYSTRLLAISGCSTRIDGYIHNSVSQKT